MRRVTQFSAHRSRSSKPSRCAQRSAAGAISMAPASAPSSWASVSSRSERNKAGSASSARSGALPNTSSAASQSPSPRRSRNQAAQASGGGAWTRKRWQRLSTVAGRRALTSATSTISTPGRGSSSVFSSALAELGVSMSAGLTIATLAPVPWLESASVSLRARICSTLIWIDSSSGTTNHRSGCEREATCRQSRQRPQGACASVHSAVWAASSASSPPPAPGESWISRACGSRPCARARCKRSHLRRQPEEVQTRRARHRGAHAGELGRRSASAASEAATSCGSASWPSITRMRCGSSAARAR